MYKVILIRDPIIRVALALSLIVFLVIATFGLALLMGIQKFTEEMMELWHDRAMIIGGLKAAFAGPRKA